MKILTVYNAPNGEVRFGEKELELRAGINDEAAGLSRMSSSETCKRYYVTELGPGYASKNDFATRAQTCVLLSGRLEISLDTGEVREVETGDLVRLEDTAYDAPGRSMRVIGDVPVQVLVLQLE